MPPSNIKVILSKFRAISYESSPIQKINNQIFQVIEIFKSYQYERPLICTVNSGIETCILLNFRTFGEFLYSRFCQILFNKSPNFYDIVSLLFETVFYSIVYAFTVFRGLFYCMSLTYRSFVSFRWENFRFRIFINLFIYSSYFWQNKVYIQ